MKALISRKMLMTSQSKRRKASVNRLVESWWVVLKASGSKYYKLISGEKFHPSNTLVLVYQSSLPDKVVSFSV